MSEVPLYSVHAARTECTISLSMSDFTLETAPGMPMWWRGGTPYRVHMDVCVPPGLDIGLSGTLDPILVDILSIRCKLGDIRLWVGDSSKFSCLVSLP